MPCEPSATWKRFCAMLQNTAKDHCDVFTFCMALALAFDMFPAHEYMPSQGAPTWAGHPDVATHCAMGTDLDISWKRQRGGSPLVHSRSASFACCRGRVSARSRARLPTSCAVAGGDIL